MPIFNLICKECRAPKRRLLPEASSIALLTCDCGGGYQRDVGGPSSAVKEILDNGAMCRAVERYADAERLYKERAASADPNAGKSKRR